MRNSKSRTFGIDKKVSSLEDFVTSLDLLVLLVRVLLVPVLLVCVLLVCVLLALVLLVCDLLVLVLLVRVLLVQSSPVHEIQYALITTQVITLNSRNRRHFRYQIRQSLPKEGRFN